MGTDLFGHEMNQEPKKKRAAKEAEEPSRVPGLEAAFVARHQARWQVPPLLTPYGKNRRHLKDLAAQLSDDELLGLMDVFFDPATARKDREVDRCDYSIAAFVRLVPHLRILRQRSNGSGRTEGNVEAARRAIGGENDGHRR